MRFKDVRYEPRYMLIPGKDGNATKIHIVGDRDTRDPTSTRSFDSFRSPKEKTRESLYSLVNEVQSFAFRPNSLTPREKIVDVKRARRDTYWKERITKDFSPKPSTKKITERLLNVERMKPRRLQPIPRVLLQTFVN